MKEQWDVNKEIKLTGFIYFSYLISIQTVNIIMVLTYNPCDQLKVNLTLNATLGGDVIWSYDCKITPHLICLQLNQA